MVSLSIVVPAYNEQESLGRVIEEIVSMLEKKPLDAEIIIADDGSIDRTAEVIESLKKKYPKQIRSIIHAQNEGMAKTFSDLYASATKDFALLLHGDGQYGASVIPFVLPLLSDFDVILCTRNDDHRSLHRRIVSNGYAILAKVLFGPTCPDTRGTRCYRTEVLKKIPVRSRSVFADTERIVLATRQGYRVGSVMVQMEERVAGTATGDSVPVLLHALLDMVLFRVRLWFR